MRPLFAITTGIALYFVWSVYWVISEFALSRPKALLGSAIGALLFGFYSVTEFRRMMRGEDPRFEEERKWIQNSIQPGSQISDAKELLRGRFTLKQEAAGFSLLHGSTLVYDFSSSLSNVRLIAKNNSVISIEIEVLREERA